MGSVGAGLASVGGSIAQAQELQRKQRLEEIKQAIEQGRLGVEQGNLGVSQKYADLRGQELDLEKQREARLAAQSPTDPTVQATRDRTYLRTLLGKEPTQDQIERFAKIAPPLKVGALKQVQDPTSPTGWTWQAVDESTGIPVINQKGAPPPGGSQESVSDTTQNVVLDTPQGPKIVAVPKRTVTRKVPAGSTPRMAGPAPSPAQVIQDLGLPGGTRVLGTKPPTRGEVSKLIDPVGDADRRYKIMLDAAAKPNPQNDVAMLFNHIGMTLSAQRGARITNAEIQRAISARELSGDLQAMWERVSSGQFLTPKQRQDMLQLGKLNREFIWQQAWEKGKAESLANKIPRTLPGLPPVAGVHYVGEDVKLQKGGRARVVAVHPDGSIEVKPY